MNINDELRLNPRVNYYFETYSAPNGISVLQHNSDGSQPIAGFDSLDKSIELFGDLDIPTVHNKTEIDAIDDELSALVLNTYTKTEVGALIPNTNLTKSYTKPEIGTTLSYYSTISNLQYNYMTTFSPT